MLRESTLLFLAPSEEVTWQQELMLLDTSLSVLLSFWDPWTIQRELGWGALSTPAQHFLLHDALPDS